MAKPDEIAALMAKTLDAFGRLDILVNNAGIQHVAKLEEFPVEKWDAILAINLSSAFHTTRLALPIMRRNGYGRIVNMASAHALVGSPFKAAYVAAKHGLLGLTKVTALETAEDGITCNAICPGYVYTPLVEAQIEGQAKTHGIPRDQVIRDVLLAQQPNKRFASVEEIGALTAVSRHRGGGFDHRRGAARRRRMDGSLKRSGSFTTERRDSHGRLADFERQSSSRTSARSFLSFRAAARSAPIRPASTRRCTKRASSRTG